METALEIAARNLHKARALAMLAMTNDKSPPIVYADVGALWGQDNPLVHFLRENRRLRVVGFDPDEVECKRLQEAQPGDIYLPFGVGDTDGTKPFHVTALNGCSSFLEPDPAAFVGMPHWDLFRVTKIIDCPVRRLDGLIATGEIPQPDFLKIDSQGYELNILKGLGSRLSQVIGIRLETQLRPAYKGQATFYDIHGFLLASQFILRDLRLTYPWQYEALEFEAYFSPDPRSVRDRFQLLKVWEVLHDIPPGRTIKIRDGKVDWIPLPL